MTKAENRLRIIEQISKFREDKIKNEFIKLENELKLEEEKNCQMQMKELKKQKYHDHQKDQLEKYMKEKMEKQKQK